MLTSGMFVDDFDWSPDSRELLYGVDHYSPKPEFLKSHVALHADSNEYRLVDAATGQTRTIRGPFGYREHSLRGLRWLDDGNIALLEWHGMGTQMRWTVVDRSGAASPKVTSREKLLWSGYTGEPPDTVTWMMNADGTDTVRVTEPDWHPHWSNAAKRKARVESDSAGSHLFVTDSLGGHRRRVADSADSPQWFPDGKWLIYVKRFGKDYYSPALRLVVSADGRYRGWMPETVTFAPTGDRVFRMVGDSIVVSRIRVRVVRGNAGAPPDWRM